MKTFLLSLLLCGAAHALTPCSTSGTRGSPPKKCPSGMTCQITNKGRPEVDMPNSGHCVKKATKTPFIDYNKAYNAFKAVDVDHSGTITFGGAYTALTKLFPNADEKTLDHLTKKGDKTHVDSKTHKLVYRDGKIDQSEFITMYRDLVRQQNHGSSNPCKDPSACGDEQMCYLCKSQKGFCCKNIVTVGPTEKPNGGLSQSELAQVTNIFEALNTQKSSSNGGLSHESLSFAELTAMLRKVSSTSGSSSHLYAAIIKLLPSIDANHDSQVDFKEFVTTCAKLKKSDPKDFPSFLKLATSMHMLPVGSSCVPTKSQKCAKGSSCLPMTQVQQPYDGPAHPDGHLLVPVPPPRRSLSATYRCQMRPSGCEACVGGKGKWFGSHCIVAGEPMVYDAPMVTTLKGCKRATAMKNAKCNQYTSCNLCTARKDKTLGQLCAWRSSGKGLCTQYQTGYFFGPQQISSPAMCGGGIVHVHD